MRWMGLGRRIAPLEAKRRIFTIVAVSPILGALAISVGLALQEGGGRELGCWVLPNGRVMLTPGEDRCPLRLHDQIRRVVVPGAGSVPVESSASLRGALAGSSVRVAVERGGGEEWFEVPVWERTRAKRLLRVAGGALVGAVLLVLPLSLLWHSRSLAAVPFALLYTATGVVVVTLICGRGSDWLARESLLAMTSAPAVLAHLSLTFPKERRLIREAPELAWVPYGFTALLVPAGWFALDRDALLWPTYMYLLLALTGGGWLILISSCAFAIRESTSQVERARARVLCFGALLLPVVPTLALARNAVLAEEAIITYLWVSAVLIPLPIGLAISRYNLFNLELDARHWVGRFAYLGTGALVVSFGIGAASWVSGTPRPIPDPVLLFGASFICVLALDPLRGRMLGLLESRIAPRLAQLRRLREEYERQVAQLREEDEVARRLGELLRDALRPASGCVFLGPGGAWRPAFLFGVDAPTRVALAEQGAAALGDRSIVHFVLAPEEDEDALHGVLRDAGVVVAAAVDGGWARLGLVLLGVGAGGAPYTGVELDFVATAASLAGIALCNARLTQDLLAVERQATTGRVALALAHDLGKELDWLGRLVDRLPQRLDDRGRLVRDVSMIREFTDGLVSGLREFVAAATAPVFEPPGTIRGDELIDNAIRRMERIHGADRVTRSIAPRVRSVHCHANLERAIANLLDNAIHATPEPESVHLFATLDTGCLRVVVADHGCGIEPDAIADVFEPGYSTRTDRGGLGIGLTVSREIVESLGGSIDLESDPTAGTRVTVRVPAELKEVAR